MFTSVVTETQTMANRMETLLKVLKRIAKNQKYDNPGIIVKATSSGGANFTTNLFTAIIREEHKEELHLFAKVASKSLPIRNIAYDWVYNTEKFAYQNLTKIYESLEKENGVPAEHRLYFTKCYGFNTKKYDETIVMENLLAKGYETYDRFHSYDWAYASSATTDLAKMHALSFAFNKKNPKAYENTLRTLEVNWVKGSIDDRMKTYTNIALNHVKPEHKEALKKFLAKEKYRENFRVKFCAPVRVTAIIHADFRGDNLLHRVREDGKVDIKIVDLQTLQGGSPLTDLIYFIFTGSDEEFRAKYFDKLVEHYYKELCAAMKRLNLEPEEIFSREDFDCELKEKMPFGLTLAVFALPIVTVDSANAPEVNENTDVSTLAVERTSDLYTERLNGVVNDYVKWGILK